MTYASILNTLGSYERQFGAASFMVRGSAKVSKHDPIAFNNLFSGDQASVNAASYVVAPVTYLMGNDYEKVDVEGINITIGTTETPMTATLERVWLDDPRPRAGRTCSAEGPLPHLSRRGNHSHAADRDPAQRQRDAVGPWCPTAAGSACRNSARRARRRRGPSTR